MLKNNDYITSFEAAKIIGVSPEQVRKLIYQGKIKAEKLGTIWVIKRKAVKGITRIRHPKKDMYVEGSDKR